MPPQPGAAVVPEPLAGAVREALLWAVSTSSSQRLLAAARSAVGADEEEQDALYEAAAWLLAARPYRGAAHPELVRATLLRMRIFPCCSCRTADARGCTIAYSM
ncbi:hypothetical protein [Streptomyces sp. NPDC005181]|uniref:hypothetical protein n=1 Tax=Streptomyces sp. NPDC005181 TaxID=3156869 RepID=UPI0033BC91F7